MRALGALVMVAATWAVMQACASGNESTSGGSGGSVDASADQTTGGSGGSDAATGGTGGPGGTGGTGATNTGATGGTGTGATGGAAGSAGAAGAGGSASSVCYDCSATSCSTGEVCTALLDDMDAGVGGQAGADGGAAVKKVCLKGCNLSAPSCPTGFTCQAAEAGGAVCHPDNVAACKAGLADGAPCGSDPQCASGHCGNGFCCASGVCCGKSADCPYSSTQCSDPATCQGQRTGEVCKNNQCAAGSEDDDSGCTAQTVSKTCGGYPSVNCSGDAVQTAPSCATSCSTNSDCASPAECQFGHCCAPGTFDFDSDPTTCECQSTPGAGAGAVCAGAIDLGTLSDTGETKTAGANLLPNRVVWYKFQAVDTADTSCDKFNVQVKFLSNPGNGYELIVSRGNCNTQACSGAAGTEYDWKTNFRGTVNSVLAGQCPCTASGATPVTDVSTCTDDSAPFYVQVRLKSGYTPTTCDGFSLQVSNGL